MRLFLELLVTPLAILGISARLTRLIGADKITAPVRAKLTVWTKSTSLSDFLVCPWCTGFWVSILITYGAWLVHGWPFADIHYFAAAVAIALSSSYVIGLLANLEDD
jgi:hypothetical protein